MEGGQKPDPRRFGEMGTKGKKRRRRIRSGREDPRRIGEIGTKSVNFKKEWKWQRGIVTHPLNESRWVRSQFSVRNGSMKSMKTGASQQKDFETMHVATDGSLL